MPSDGVRRRDRRLIWILAGALAIAIALLFAALARSAGDETGTSSQPTGEATAAEVEATQAPSSELPDLSRRIDDDPLAVGDADAPVVIVEFADYRCPFCGVHARDTLPAIVDEYVDEGLVRIEWRDMPIFGDESFNAAVAARAAGEQGRFWQYNAAVYAYTGNDHQSLPRERLIEIAAEAGVPDIPAFEQALDDTELAAAVTLDAQEAESLGVSSTPTFAVGGTAVMGAQPLDTFRQVIDDELAKAGS